MSKVNVFFRTTTVTHIEEQPLMLPFDLVSGIGGTLGLFVGMSLLSMCEVVQLVCEIIVGVRKEHVAQVRHKISNERQ